MIETKPKIKLNLFQIGWLDSHGARNSYDVEEDEKGPYVWMTDGFGDIKVYIPLKEGKTKGKTTV